MDTWGMLDYFAMSQSVVGAVAAGFLLAQISRNKRLTKEVEGLRIRCAALEEMRFAYNERYHSLLDRMREVVE